MIEKHSSTDYFDRGTTRTEFQNEINLMVKVQERGARDNRHIIQYHAAYVDDKAFYLVMDYASGGGTMLSFSSSTSCL
jgi:hypothetical protein